jgi:hypothetical protein
MPIKSRRRREQTTRRCAWRSRSLIPTCPTRLRVPRSSRVGAVGRQALGRTSTSRNELVSQARTLRAQDSRRCLYTSSCHHDLTHCRIFEISSSRVTTRAHRPEWFETVRRIEPPQPFQVFESRAQAPVNAAQNEAAASSKRAKCSGSSSRVSGSSRLSSRS